jgi:hypothetical protein
VITSPTALLRRAMVNGSSKPALKEFTMFKSNVGGLDRILRVVVGIALLALVFVGPQTIWGLFGIVPLVTGLFGTCPVYSLLGINTCGVKRVP